MTRSLTGVLFLSMLAHAAAQRTVVVGWVTACSGDWEDRTNAEQPLKIACRGARGELWHPLSRASKLALTSHKTHEWLDVRIARTGEKHRFDCDKPGECDPPPLPFLRFVPKKESAGVLQPFLESPREAYARVRLLLSKSENDESGRVTADHAVVADNERIPLRDLIRPTAPGGEYLLELCPFDEKNGCPNGGKPLSIKWSADSSANWPNSASAGLYEIVLSKIANGITLRTPDRGLLLVAPSQNVATEREKVQAGEQVFLKDWKDQSEGRLMFQALLVDLAARGK
jgi:hypothetical protein